jgi:hypothetical protein
MENISHSAVVKLQKCFMQELLQTKLYLCFCSCFAVLVAAPNGICLHTHRLLLTLKGFEMLLVPRKAVCGKKMWGGCGGRILIPVTSTGQELIPLCSCLWCQFMLSFPYLLSRILVFMNITPLSDARKEVFAPGVPSISPTQQVASLQSLFYLPQRNKCPLVPDPFFVCVMAYISVRQNCRQ